MPKAHSFEEIERHLIVCKVSRFTTEESLQYLKDKGHDISETTFFVHKRKLKDGITKRVTSAVEGQVESILHLKDTIEIIQKKLWEDLDQTTDIMQKLKIMNSIRDNEVMITKLTMDIPETVEKQVTSYRKLPVDRKLTKEEYGKWKLDSDIERFETAMNDPTDPFSSPLDEIRLKHMKDMRDKNVTKRQN